MQIALTATAKNLEKKWTLQEKPQEHRSSEHMFKVSDLVFLYKHNKEQLELHWELGSTIVALPPNWIARIRNKETAEPKSQHWRFEAQLKSKY